MFAYYTAARWFAMTLDLILLVFSSVVAITQVYAVTDSSHAGKFCRGQTSGDCKTCPCNYTGF